MLVLYTSSVGLNASRDLSILFGSHDLAEKSLNVTVNSHIPNQQTGLLGASFTDHQKYLFILICTCI